MECARRVFPVKDLPFSYSFRTYANAIWEESVRFGFCKQNREKRGSRGTGPSANRCLLRLFERNREKRGSRGTGALGEQVLAASVRATVRSEVAEARGPRRTDACCVCSRNREKRGSRGTGPSANRCLLRKSYSFSILYPSFSIISIVYHCLQIFYWRIVYKMV